MPYVIGVDTGGTFTDCVVLDDADRVYHDKARSTPTTWPSACCGGRQRRRRDGLDRQACWATRACSPTARRRG